MPARVGSVRHLIVSPARPFEMMYTIAETLRPTATKHAGT
jgi:hypothetical protein